MALLDQECSRCGLSLRRAFLLAMLTDAGAKTYPDAVRCDAEHEHDFRSVVCHRQPLPNPQERPIP